MLHIKKLCVGVESLARLRAYQANRKRLYHDTRNFPRRAEEILQGGSLYWIIKGNFAARQPIVDLQALHDNDGRAFCRIVLATELIDVRADQHRPFQGWRYLEVDKAPADTHIDLMGQAVPGSLAAELDRLGVAAMTT